MDSGDVAHDMTRGMAHVWNAKAICCAIRGQPQLDYAAKERTPPGSEQSSQDGN